ncbi:MAG: exopolyphosphatase [Cytophagales bacterium]|nr:exopolyphosphatase [Cytophagales bacterium]
MAEKIGIIDLGTNTFHLLIAEVQVGKMRILHRERQAVRIGKGGINDGLIREDAIARALDCLHSFKQVLSSEGVSRIQALATSALRSATNAPEILQRIRKDTGLEVSIISGEQEAAYIYFGIRSAMNLGKEKSLIVDIGGGSVEFIIANQEEMFWKQSVDIGAQRLLERYQKHDPIQPEEITQLMNHYSESLHALHQAMDELQPKVMVGSSGTFDTLSEIYCLQKGVAFQPDDPETPLSVEAFQEIHQELITRNREGRLKIPGMVEMRVDMIVVASCLIHYIATRFEIEKIRVSGYSLKEGVLATLAESPRL